MTYTYQLNCSTSGDGGEGMEQFDNPNDVLTEFHKVIKEFPDDSFDITILDEDGDWIGFLLPNGEWEEM